MQLQSRSHSQTPMTAVALSSSALSARMVEHVRDQKFQGRTSGTNGNGASTTQCLTLSSSKPGEVGILGSAGPLRSRDESIGVGPAQREGERDIYIYICIYRERVRESFCCSANRQTVHPQPHLGGRNLYLASQIEFDIWFASRNLIK